jgi:predicted house-cleaning NTP pyrophosphatase (Maf/HAM1 superfamily)
MPALVWSAQDKAVFASESGSRRTLLLTHTLLFDIVTPDLNKQRDNSHDQPDTTHPY